MLEVLDFLERLAPFTDPDRVLRDERPLMAADTEVKDAVAGLKAGAVH